jgi:hypothetical protein
MSRNNSNSRFAGDLHGVPLHDTVRNNTSLWNNPWWTLFATLVVPWVIGMGTPFLMSYLMDLQHPPKSAEQRLTCVELPESSAAFADAPKVRLRLKCQPDP